MPSPSGQTVAKAVPNAPTFRERVAAPLEAHLRPDLYIPELKSTHKATVLDELVDALARAGVTRAPDAVREALRQREALGSTGIGKGIAVPHARSTMVSGRAIVVARSTRGIDFESADGEPVHLFFLIVAPPLERDAVYLQLLARIVRAVRLVRTRRRFLEAPDFETIRTLLVRASDE
jgi:mannitol/fructose-specific phosphotransferase system IIA component (Ntr-type)